MKVFLSAAPCLLLCFASCAADPEYRAPDAEPGETFEDGGREPGDDDSGASGDASAHDASFPDSEKRCEPGVTTTQWAEDCPTEPKQCKPGTWTNPGSTTNDPVQCESTHFAVHAPAGTITSQQCKNATDTLENLIWPTYFGPTMLLPEPYCDSTTKFKASIVVHNGWGLTGGGWGNGYMGMWVGPGATSDHWGLAHEFMHAVQSQTKGLACGGPAVNNFCGWIYESHANFSAHQLEEYRGEVHCSEMLVNAPHLYLGSTRDRYCNWQFMEFLKDKYCIGAVNDIWNAPTPSNDPFTNIAATRNFTVSQLNDFFGEWAMHNVTWDYRNPDGSDQGAVYRSKYGKVTDTSSPERRLRTTRLVPMEGATQRYTVHSLQAPQRWGYNIVRLIVEPDATEVRVQFRGVVQDAASSDWRWGLVATDASLSKPRYSSLQRGSEGTLRFCTSPGESLFLVVVATPKEQQHIVWDQAYPTIYRYPYMLEIEGAAPEGTQPDAPNPSATGKRWSNGGGWVSNAANVAEGAYVGPYAAVLSGTVGANARIDELAIVDGATVNGGTVSGLSVLRSGLTVSGNATVRLGWPYAPGFFERPQSVSGTATLLGDLELRGANTSKTSGSFCGFADGATDDNCSMPDVTLKSWSWEP